MTNDLAGEDWKRTLGTLSALNSERIGILVNSRDINIIDRKRIEKVEKFN